MMPKKRFIPERNLRIADQIQQDLAQLIQSEIKNPAIRWITLNSVELSRDYAHAKIYFSSLFGIPEVLQKALNQSAGYLRHLLFKRLHIHTIPTLHFLWDSAPERALHMEALIRLANANTCEDSILKDEINDDGDSESFIISKKAL